MKLSRLFVLSRLGAGYRRSRLTWSLPLVTAAALALPGLAQELRDRSARDQSIVRTIQENLVLDSRIRPDLIQVESENGSVTLTGQAETLLAQRAAAQLARAVQGVRQVRNEIELTPVGRNDANLRKLVLMELAGAPNADVFDMNVEVRDGVVTLTGTVDSWGERQRAVEAAQNVPGVARVVNGLSVRSASEPPDTRLAETVERRIRSDQRLDSSRITVEARQGGVRLSGLVENVLARQRVLRHAWTAGAQSVSAAELLIARQEPVRSASIDWQRGVSDSTSAGRSSSNRTTLQDDQITVAVERALDRDRRINPQGIGVSTENGEVRLSGAVETLFAKEWAVDLANAVRGVRGVYDDLAVRAADRQGQELLDDILRDLSVDPATQSQRLHVQVEDGAVRLSGQVRSWAQWQQAEDVVKRVRGVKEVHNNLIVRAAVTRPDVEVAADVRSSLRRDARLADNQVEVEVRNGRVSLRGTVGSELEKRTAIAAAQVLNVRSIDSSELQVIPNRAARRWPDTGQASDREIQTSVLQLFRQHPFLSPSAIEVEVADGTVILSGQVDDEQSKWAATREASRVAGVDRVRNFLLVRARELNSNRQVANRLERTFQLDPYLDAENIDVSLDERAVNLDGVVDSTFQRIEAEQVAAELEGISQVRNNLRVGPDTEGYETWPFYDLNPAEGTAEFDPPVTLTDSQLETRIQRRVASHPLLQDDRVRVRVIQGQVRMSGEVDSLRERTLASRLARRAGAGTVNNMLDIAADQP